MSRMPGDQVILLGRQPFRCQWRGIASAPGVERHLVVDRRILDRLDAVDLARGFSNVYPLDGVDDASVADLIDRLVARGRPVASIATNDEYMLGMCARLQERHGLEGPSPADIAVFTDKMAMKHAALRAGLRTPVGMALNLHEAAADPQACARRVFKACGLPLAVQREHLMSRWCGRRRSWSVAAGRCGATTSWPRSSCPAECCSATRC